MPLKYRKGCDVFRDKSEIVLKKEDLPNLKRRHLEVIILELL